MAGNGVYNPALLHFAQGDIAWKTSGYDWCLLCGNNAPTKADAHYSDIGADELAEAGNYTQGGMQIPATLAVTQSTADVLVDGGNCAWTSATFSAYYANIYHAATTKLSTGPLITFHNLSGPQTVVSGTLTLQWSTSPDCIFKLTSSAET